ncbi:MAG: hypothetical protein ACAF42_16250 [Limnothrix sp. BL-A-16]
MPVDAPSPGPDLSEPIAPGPQLPERRAAGSGDREVRLVAPLLIAQTGMMECIG